MTGFSGPPADLKPLPPHGDSGRPRVGHAAPARPRLSAALAEWCHRAQDERLPYSDRALACRVTAALAAAEATLQVQAQTLALLAIGDHLAALRAVLTPPPQPVPGAPQPD